MVQIEEKIYKELLQQKDLISYLEMRIQLLEEKLRLAANRQFAPSSEQLSSEQLALLFNELEATADPEAPEPEVETVTYTRRRGGQRTLDLGSLRTEEIHYTLPDEEKVCPQCEGQLHEMGAYVRQELKFIPAELVLVKHICAKYACRHCQIDADTTPILLAPMPQPAFPASLASPSLVANILHQKYVLSVPLYRQAQDLQRRGLDISRQNLSNWAIRGADLLAPLYDHLRTLLLKLKFLHADETEFQVLHEKGRAAQRKSYLWLYRSGRDGPQIVLYEYQPTREATHPQKFLLGFIGYLHVDGYAAYDTLLNVVLVGCWAHARRQFTDALAAQSAEVREKGGTEAHKGLKFCQELFKIESDLRDVAPEERYAARLERSKPVLDKMYVWLQSAKCELLPKSATGRAVGYCLNQWSKLICFLEDGHLEIDNNRSERAIKPFVIGRKNWLFSNVPKGASSSAIIYSIIETAKENSLDLFRYLTYLFEQLPNINVKDTSALDNLLPWADEIQSKFSVPKKPSRAK